MSKNVFMLLNSDDYFWVHLCYLKYVDLNNWTNKPLKNVSNSFRALCLAAAKIKSNCLIKECNPGKMNFLLDPWLFKIPLAFKPTFINMSLLLDNFSANDCVDLYEGNYDTCRLLFGDNFDWSFLRKGCLNRESKNYWAWTSKATKSSLANSINSWLYQNGTAIEDS